LSSTSAKPPSALLSYSHDSPEHEQRVLELCNRLRARGVDAFVDQFLAGAPSEGWPLWMERQIEQRDFTLMVCTNTYRERFMEEGGTGAGHGIVWEARILRNLLYHDAGRHARIVPIFLDPAARASVPNVFRGHYYDLSDERGFENLLRHLLGEPGAQAGALGPLGPQGSRWSAFERPWLVPDALRTRYFTGRADALALLQRQLAERGRAVLCGLGGVGKTQLALEYAVRHRASYLDGVFWTDAETLGGLTTGFVAIAATLGLPSADANDQKEAVRAVLAWLDSTENWLLVFDNVDNRADLRRFVPQRGRGHILITSRESVFQEFGIARPLEVVDLDAAEAVRFLLVRTGREDANPSDRATGAELAAELGNLPLALEQAAAYIVETNAAFAAYLGAFRKRRIALLEKAGPLVPHQTVAVTWAANFEAVAAASAAAAEVLRISALLAPEAIPFELFALADSDELAMGEVLRPLARYSLIRSDAALRTFSVHRLVQEIVRAAIPEPEGRTYVEHAVRALEATLPAPEYENWARCDRLVAHIASVSAWVESYGVESAGAIRLLNQIGRYLIERGRYAGAKPLLERAVALGEPLLGPDHADVATSLGNLALVHYYQGNFAESLSLNERALAARERAFGLDHPKVAGSLNNIASVHLAFGRYADAEHVYGRALAIWERALGSEHPLVATSLNNIAYTQFRQGRHAEARPLAERALAIRERTLGPEHPHVAITLGNLAEICRKEGRDADALPLHERALAIRERALGPDHEEVAESLAGLAALHAGQGRFAESGALYERSLAILERALGPDHLDVAGALVGLGSVRKAEGRTAEAVALYERALVIKERTFEVGHPELTALLKEIGALRAQSPTL
jgi:tetratricopeptide (TPR) repeat protein